MRFKSLPDWLQWQQSLNPKSIDLGLDRVRQVYHRLGIDQIAERVITVAGTNGKGSTVAYYETWLKNKGIHVASYTSPHLLHYNERIKLDTRPVNDDQLIKAFAVVDEARGDVSLTYFEFGTLAAFYLMNQFKPEVAILEVGLGGRLDAVNIIDADLSHITPIGLDHQDWLGNDRETIGREKAGILRSQCKAVINDKNPPASVIKEVERLDCEAMMISTDYDYRWLDAETIKWTSGQQNVQIRPPLPGEHQAQNISGVMAGLSLLGLLDYDDNMMERFPGFECAGRLQEIETHFPFQLWVDVGHNEDAARVQADYFSKVKGKGKMVVLLGMLADKNVTDFITQLKPVVDEWWLLGLDGYRGLSSSQLAQRISSQVNISHLSDNVDQVLADTVSSLGNQDILLVTGSFLTVEAVLSSSVYFPETHGTTH